MCYKGKCFNLPVEYACVLLGFSTLVLAIILTMFSITILTLEEMNAEQGCYYIKVVTGLDLTSSTVKIVMSSYLMVEIMLMVFSIVLIVGMWMNRTNFVLSYFFYGIIVVFVGLVTGLLLLLQKHWLLSLAVFFASVLYIQCLVAVYRAYELMHQGKILGLSEQRSREEGLLDSFDDNNI